MSKLEKTADYRILVPDVRPLPNDTQCECGYFDTGHPDVRRILKARSQDHGHYEFLLHGAQCRCESLEERRRGAHLMRQAQANLPQRGNTFSNFVKREGTEEAVEAAREFAEGSGSPTLVLLGTTGSGKSHLLEALGKHLVETSGWTGRYDTAVGFLERLRESYNYTENTGDLTATLSWYQTRKVVLLDDLGAEKESDWTAERLTELIDERMRMRYRLAIATNLPQAAMRAQLGDRIASRIFQTNGDLGDVRRVTLTCSDYRMGGQDNRGKASHA